ncbi:hypothetical protein JST99_03210 [Candidatus Dependentiae bacterium]|nr:hypothetical protein [Candidatus Dependentiae bacterium]MCC7414990.1 hypothetical protein [Campylobacterota bacterium]
MFHIKKSRAAKIFLLCLTLSVVDKGWVTKTHSLDIGAAIISQELLYVATLACSCLWRAYNNANDSVADRIFHQEIQQIAKQNSTSAIPPTVPLRMPQQTSSLIHKEHIKPVPIAQRILPIAVKKVDNTEKAKVVICHVTQEQITQLTYAAIPETEKVAAQELVRHVAVDWHKQLEQRSSEAIRSAQAHAYNHMFTELRALNPGYTSEIHPNGGVTYRAPNPLFYCYLGPSRQRHPNSLANDIAEQRLNEQIQIKYDPYVRAAIEHELCGFLNNARYLMYGTLLERIAALVYVADFHIETRTFGQELYDVQRQIYAHYVHTDGSLCIDRLSDMTHAHAIIKKYVACQKKIVPVFEKSCVHARSPCTSDIIKNKKNVDLKAINNNRTNQRYRNMLTAFASGDMQQVEQIKNSNSSTRGIQTLYEQIRAKYNTLVGQQEALSKDAYGILHFHLPVALQDPLYTSLADGDHAKLQSNPSALASFNDALRLRNRYKQSLHKAWNISYEAEPIVHQALYALIDSGIIPERIDKIHELSTDPNISLSDRKKIVQALFLPNGIIKDFAEYDRAQSLKVPATILEEECAQIRLLLNRIVYTERVCNDEQITSECAAAVEYVQKSLTTNDKESAERYLFYAQSMFDQIESDLILLNSEQQPTGNTNKTPQQKQSPEPKEPKNNKPDPSSRGTAAVALLNLIDESKEKAIEVFNKTHEWLLSEKGWKTVMHCFKDKPNHNFGPLLSRMTGDTRDVWTKVAIDVTKKLVDMGTQLPIDSAGIFEEVLVAYEGELITVQGAVMDGMVKISTMFIKDIHVR